jgi:CubicO group peptidase (beta-lactamase class C family)
MLPLPTSRPSAAREPIAEPAYVYRQDPLGGHLTYANYTFALSARDLARFGQLHLQRGNWDDVSVVPPNWVRAATS